MAENISPEERLFKVIQETKKSTEQEPLHINKSSDSKGLKRVFENIIGKFKPNNQKAPGPATSSIIPPIELHHIDLRKVNKGLCVVLAFLIALSAYYVLKRPNLSKVTGVVFVGDYQVKSAKPIETFKQLAFYIEQVKNRDIFNPVTSGVKGFVSSNLQTLTKELGLAGIYQPVDKPLEAMIEDRAAKKTYFLKAGDEIKGMKVKAILKDRVILQYGEEEMELM